MTHPPTDSPGTGPLDDEVRFHLEQRIAEFMAVGHSREEAVRMARARFGDVADLKEYCRQMDARIHARTDGRRRRGARLGWFSDLLLDVRHAWRQVLRSRTSTLVAMLTLALGIGGTTATYAAVRKLLISPIPGVDLTHLVRISRSNEAGTFSVTPNMELANAWAANVSSLEDLAMFSSREASVALSVSSTREALDVGLMSPNLPSMLGLAPAIGRIFDDSETGVAMLTYGVWQTRFAGDASVLGRTVAIDGTPHTIVGVLPRRFTIPFMTSAKSQLWIPADEKMFPQVIGRVRPGVSDDQLLSELNTVLNSLDNQGFDADWTSKISRPLDDVSQTTQDSLLVLFGAVAIVLLAGCANVANLLLARAQVRRQEFVIRQSLGASRGRIIRQLLTESSLLALGGWGLGLGVAWMGLRLVEGLRPDALAMLDGISLDGTLVIWSLVVSAGTSLLFGLAPALFAAGRGLSSQLRLQSRSATADRSAGRWRAGFVMLEVALSVMLLIGAGLLIRTLVEMQRAPLGFEPAGLYRATILLPEDRYTTNEARGAAFEQIRARAGALPGVARAAWSTGVPPELGVSVGTLQIEGRDNENTGREFIGFNMTAPDYFELTGTPLVDGRLFTTGPGGEREILINQRFAKEQWPDQSAVGQRLRLSASGPWSLVVGVVGDVTIPRPGGTGSGGVVSRVTYTPFDASWGEGVLLLRARPGVDGLPALFSQLSRLTEEVDANIKVSHVAPALDAVNESQALPRFIGTLLIAFAVMAVLLSSVGLYGVIAYTVTRRWREMGIRLALGARAADVLRPVLVEGAWMTGAGLALGLAGAALSAKALGSLLYQVTPFDAATFAAAGTLLALVALAAVYLPARRATHVDPVTVLRDE